MSGIRLVEIELLIDIYLYSILCEYFAKQGYELSQNSILNEKKMDFNWEQFSF